MKLLFPKLLLNKQSKISLEYIGAFLLIVFCNFWLYKARPFIPLYYFYLATLSFIPLIAILKMVGKLSKGQVLSIICSLWIFSTFLYQNHEDWQYIIHPGTATSCYAIVVFLINYLNKKQVLNITNIMLILNAIYISAETYWRISHPITSRDIGTVINSNLDSSFYLYIYKSNSFIIADSNSIGLMLLVLLSLTVYLYVFVNKNNLYKYLIIIYIILTILSFSRAAIIASSFAAFIIGSYYFLKKQIKLFKKTNKITLQLLLYIILVPFLFFFIGTTIIIYLLKDQSFATKIDLFSVITKYFHITSINHILFGVGTNLELSNKCFGRYPHTIILTYLAWYGIVGTCLIYYWWWIIIKETRYKALYIFLPQIFAGISYTMPGLHIFYVALGIIYYFEKHNKKRIVCH